MRTQLRKIKDKNSEQVIIECVEITPEIKEIYAYATSKGRELTGSCGEYTKKFRLEDVFYFEAVEKKTFAYTKDDVFEVRMKLYEIVEAFEGQHFIRCSKSIVVNLMKLEKISPILNGKFLAHMKNGEQVIVSRQYVPELKAAVMGGESGEK